MKMKQIDRPPPFLVVAPTHAFDNFTDAVVGFDSRIPLIIESTQDVVVPKCGNESGAGFVDNPHR
jgi:hypothetical protein